MNKKVVICIALIALGTFGLVGYYLLKQQSNETTPTAKYVTFPFSWEEEAREANIEISVVNITALGKNLEKIGLSIEAEEGYQFYGVYVTFRNMGHEHFYFHGTGVSAYLELITDRENVYRPSRGTTNPVRLYDLRPEEEDGTWSVFEIRNDEKPLELRDYEVLDGGLYIAYIWKIEE